MKQNIGLLSSGIQRFYRPALFFGLPAYQLIRALPVLDSIGGLMELQSDPNHFPNTCFAGTYRLAEVTGYIP